MKKNIIIAVLAVTTILSTVYALYQKTEAEKQEALAKEFAIKAQEQMELALKERNRAEQQMRVAQERANEAMTQAQIALDAQKKKK